MLERSIAIVLLSLGGAVISYGTGLYCLAASRDEGARLLAAGLLLGVTLIAFGALIDRDHRRHRYSAQAPDAAGPVIPPPADGSAIPPPTASTKPAGG